MSLFVLKSEEHLGRVFKMNKEGKSYSIASLNESEKLPIDQVDTAVAPQRSPVLRSVEINKSPLGGLFLENITSPGTFKDNVELTCFDEEDEYNVILSPGNAAAAIATTGTRLHMTAASAHEHMNAQTAALAPGGVLASHKNTGEPQEARKLIVLNGTEAAADANTSAPPTEDHLPEENQLQWKASSAAYFSACPLRPTSPVTSPKPTTGMPPKEFLSVCDNQGDSLPEGKKCVLKIIVAIPDSGNEEAELCKSAVLLCSLIRVSPATPQGHDIFTSSSSEAQQKALRTTAQEQKLSTVCFGKDTSDVGGERRFGAVYHQEVLMQRRAQGPLLEFTMGRTLLLSTERAERVEKKNAEEANHSFMADDTASSLTVLHIAFYRQFEDLPPPPDTASIIHPKNNGSKELTRHLPVSPSNESAPASSRRKTLPSAVICIPLWRVPELTALQSSCCSDPVIIRLTVSLFDSAAASSPSFSLSAHSFLAAAPLLPFTTNLSTLRSSIEESFAAAASGACSGDPSASNSFRNFPCTVTFVSSTASSLKSEQTTFPVISHDTEKEQHSKMSATTPQLSNIMLPQSQSADAEANKEQAAAPEERQRAAYLSSSPSNSSFQQKQQKPKENLQQASAEHQQQQQSSVHSLEGLDGKPQDDVTLAESSKAAVSSATPAAHLRRLSAPAPAGATYSSLRGPVPEAAPAIHTAVRTEGGGNLATPLLHSSPTPAPTAAATLQNGVSPGGDCAKYDTTVSLPLISGGHPHKDTHPSGFQVYQQEQEKGLTCPDSSFRQPKQRLVSSGLVPTESGVVRGVCTPAAHTPQRTFATDRSGSCSLMSMTGCPDSISCVCAQQDHHNAVFPQKKRKEQAQQQQQQNSLLPTTCSQQKTPYTPSCPKKREGTIAAEAEDGRIWSNTSSSVAVVTRTAISRSQKAATTVGGGESQYIMAKRPVTAAIDGSSTGGGLDLSLPAGNETCFTHATLESQEDIYPDDSVSVKEHNSSTRRLRCSTSATAVDRIGRNAPCMQTTIFNAENRLLSLKANATTVGRMSPTRVAPTESGDPALLQKKVSSSAGPSGQSEHQLLSPHQPAETCGSTSNCSAYNRVKTLNESQQQQQAEQQEQQQQAEQEGQQQQSQQQAQQHWFDQQCSASWCSSRGPETAGSEDTCSRTAVGNRSTLTSNIRRMDALMMQAQQILQRRKQKQLLQQQRQAFQLQQQRLLLLQQQKQQKHQQQQHQKTGGPLQHVSVLHTTPIDQQQPNAAVSFLKNTKQQQHQSVSPGQQHYHQQLPAEEYEHLPVKGPLACVTSNTKSPFVCNANKTFCEPYTARTNNTDRDADASKYSEDPRSPMVTFPSSVQAHDYMHCSSNSDAGAANTQRGRATAGTCFAAFSGGADSSSASVLPLSGAGTAAVATALTASTQEAGAPDFPAASRLAIDGGCSGASVGVATALPSPAEVVGGVVVVAPSSPTLSRAETTLDLRTYPSSLQRAEESLLFSATEPFHTTPPQSNPRHYYHPYHHYHHHQSRGERRPSEISQPLSSVVAGGECMKQPKREPQILTTTSCSTLAGEEPTKSTAASLIFPSTGQKHPSALLPLTTDEKQQEPLRQVDGHAPQHADERLLSACKQVEQSDALHRHHDILHAPHATETSCFTRIRGGPVEELQDSSLGDKIDSSTCRKLKGFTPLQSSCSILRTTDQPPSATAAGPAAAGLAAAGGAAAAAGGAGGGAPIIYEQATAGHREKSNYECEMMRLLIHQLSVQMQHIEEKLSSQQLLQVRQRQGNKRRGTSITRSSSKTLLVRRPLLPSFPAAAAVIVGGRTQLGADNTVRNVAVETKSGSKKPARTSTSSSSLWRRANDSEHYRRYRRFSRCSSTSSSATGPSTRKTTFLRLLEEDLIQTKKHRHVACRAGEMQQQALEIAVGRVIKMLLKGRMKQQQTRGPSRKRVLPPGLLLLLQHKAKRQQRISQLMEHSATADSKCKQGAGGAAGAAEAVVVAKLENVRREKEVLCREKAAMEEQLVIVTREREEAAGRYKQQVAVLEENLERERKKLQEQEDLLRQREQQSEMNKQRALEQQEAQLKKMFSEEKDRLQQQHQEEVQQQVQRELSKVRKHAQQLASAYEALSEKKVVEEELHRQLVEAKDHELNDLKKQTEKQVQQMQQKLQQHEEQLQQQKKDIENWERDKKEEAHVRETQHEKQLKDLQQQLELLRKQLQQQNEQKQQQQLHKTISNSSETVDHEQQQQQLIKELHEIKEENKRLTQTIEVLRKDVKQQQQQEREQRDPEQHEIVGISKIPCVGQVTRLRQQLQAVAEDRTRYALQQQQQEKEKLQLIDMFAAQGRRVKALEQQLQQVDEQLGGVLMQQSSAASLSGSVLSDVMSPAKPLQQQTQKQQKNQEHEHTANYTGDISAGCSSVSSSCARTWSTMHTHADGSQGPQLTQHLHHPEKRQGEAHIQRNVFQSLQSMRATLCQLQRQLPLVVEPPKKHVAPLLAKEGSPGDYNGNNQEQRRLCLQQQKNREIEQSEPLQTRDLPLGGRLMRRLSRSVEPQASRALAQPSSTSNADGLRSTSTPRHNDTIGDKTPAPTSLQHNHQQPPVHSHCMTSRVPLRAFSPARARAPSAGPCSTGTGTTSCFTSTLVSHFNASSSPGTGAPADTARNAGPFGATAVAVAAATAAAAAADTSGATVVARRVPLSLRGVAAIPINNPSCPTTAAGSGLSTRRGSSCAQGYSSGFRSPCPQLQQQQQYYQHQQPKQTPLLAPRVSPAPATTTSYSHTDSKLLQQSNTDVQQPSADQHFPAPGVVVPRAPAATVIRRTDTTTGLDKAPLPSAALPALYRYCTPTRIPAQRPAMSRAVSPGQRSLVGTTRSPIE